MTNDLTEYEIALLKDLAGEPHDKALRWGAAMGEAIGYLKGAGYVSLDDDGVYRITDKGVEARHAKK